MNLQSGALKREKKQWVLAIIDFTQLVKLRLTLTVVFSALMAYWIALPMERSLTYKLFSIFIGGFLITGAANALNQALEKGYDARMSRTANRPLPSGRMEESTAVLIAGVMSVFGLIILANLSLWSALLGAISLLLYAFVYTPLKRVTPISVFVGAFPGALPTMLGWVAYTGKIDIAAIVLFTVQFVWQFPHFWSIAWILEDDYKRAGFKMLPFNPGRTRKTAFQCLLFSLVLIPVGILPTVFNISGVVAAVVAVFGALYFSFYAYKLYKSCELADAKKLMMAAIIYLPIVQLFYLIDKI